MPIPFSTTFGTLPPLLLYRDLPLELQEQEYVRSTRVDRQRQCPESGGKRNRHVLPYRKAK